MATSSASAISDEVVPRRVTDYGDLTFTVRIIDSHVRQRAMGTDVALRGGVRDGYCAGYCVAVTTSA
jgi:hypothetical protein